MKDLTNQFFDINKLPAKEGILLFPISMSRISNSQNAKSCFEFMKIFSPNKIVKPMVGLNFIYGDFLYLYSDEKASELKNKFMSLIIPHKNEFLSILKKNPMLIQKGFSFTTWNQLYLESKDFVRLLSELKQIYSKDKEFQKYILEDLKKIGKKNLNENQLNFFLEENLMFYLILKGQVRLSNDFVQGHEKWILYCYPGKPLKSQIYLYQKNFFSLTNRKNKFEDCFYDLEEKKLYDFNKIDLKTLQL